MNKRLESIKEAQTSPLNVIDRSIYEDRLLFQLNADLGRATQIEASTYSDLLNNMMEQVDTSSDAQTKDPDLLIHISVSFETMLERIKRRGRDFEQIENDPSLYEYYKELTERYTKWFEAYDRSPKLQIDGDKYDFVEDEAAAQAVLKQVDDALAELNLKA
ncbi:Deoxyguanosine kinase [Weissella viridescens]|uniref:Deoxyguanosine kinase n=1 Tax=Weissella viridescens TaxID=1629 RepID=A0A380NXB0_WEIVI|nr:Deoxyguanosine kinase [Weissella viridescens]